MRRRWRMRSSALPIALTLSARTGEMGRLQDMVAAEQAARRDLETKVMKQMDEKCLALHVELAKEKKLREEAEDRMARDIQDEVSRVSERNDQERRAREVSELAISVKLDTDLD